MQAADEAGKSSCSKCPFTAKTEAEVKVHTAKMHVGQSVNRCHLCLVVRRGYFISEWTSNDGAISQRNKHHGVMGIAGKNLKITVV